MRVTDAAWHEIYGIVESIPNNNLIATMLAVSKVGRTTASDSPGMWQANAASTLLGGMIAGSTRS